MENQIVGIVSVYDMGNSRQSQKMHLFEPWLAAGGELLTLHGLNYLRTQSISACVSASYAYFGRYRIYAHRLHPRPHCSGVSK